MYFFPFFNFLSVEISSGELLSGYRGKEGSSAVGLARRPRPQELRGGEGWGQRVEEEAREYRAPTCGQREAGGARVEGVPGSRGGEAGSCHMEGSGARSQGRGAAADSWRAGPSQSDSPASWACTLWAGHTGALGSHSHEV